MKALYALAVCISCHTFAASADTLENSTATDYPTYLNDLDYPGVLGEIDGQSTTRVPGIVIVPAIEPETLIVEQDGVENDNKVEPVPGITAIQPSDEDDVTGTFDLWAGY
jgi:hypothetical protein